MNTNSWSLGILCYNEEENIENTIKKANAVLEKLQQPYEILIIDDGSSDKSKEVAHSFTRLYNKIRQAAITREVSEIVSGREALSS
jgi:glycosyltransferase involved in cell wall biosynthesis